MNNPGLARDFAQSYGFVVHVVFIVPLAARGQRQR